MFHIQLKTHYRKDPSEFKTGIIFIELPNSFLLLADDSHVMFFQINFISNCIIEKTHLEAGIIFIELTPSTLDSCSYRFKMYLIVENMPFHMVKIVFKYSV